MDNRHRNIRIAIDSCYEEIKSAQERIEDIRSKCEHPEAEEKEYMWTPGHYTRSKVCKICDKRI